MSPAAAAAASKTEVSVSVEHSELSAMTSIQKRKNKNNRRFSDEQIRLLESMFATESRPELQIKQELAVELGLKPRQVAIWFQNKRARSKSKLVEQEYNTLKSRYDTLASKLNSLKEENKCLSIQLQRMKDLMGKPQQNINLGVGQIGQSIGEDNTDANREAEKKTNLLLESYYHEMQMPLCGDPSENIDYFGEKINILNMAQAIPDSFTSGNSCDFESPFVLECQSCSSQWWDF